MFVCEMKTLRDLSVGLTKVCTCGSLCWLDDVWCHTPGTLYIIYSMCMYSFIIVWTCVEICQKCKSKNGGPVHAFVVVAI